MAEEIDSIFAKRDKKKKASKVTPDEIAKQLEINSESAWNYDPSQASLSERAREESSVVERLGLDKPEEEWNEDVDDGPDYSVLKIQPMTIHDREEEEAERRRAVEDELRREANEQGGPWSKMFAEKTATAEQDDSTGKDEGTKAEECIKPSSGRDTPLTAAAAVASSTSPTPDSATSEEVEKSTPFPPAEIAPTTAPAPAKAAYVPPHLRGAAGASITSPSGTSPTPPATASSSFASAAAGGQVLEAVKLSSIRRAGATGATGIKGSAPKLESEMEFPSLG